VIVGYLGETDALFEETYALLKNSPISRFHVFRFSNRPNTAAYYMAQSKKKADCHVTSKSEVPRNDIEMFEPSADEKKERSARLIELSRKKYANFLSTQVGRSCKALVIAKQKNRFKLLLDNHVEGYIESKHCLPGQLLHVTIKDLKNNVLGCR
jgi:threonylcarbamoyladenosine tRNA methylthiotransferase MtaB